MNERPHTPDRRTVLKGMASAIVGVGSTVFGNQAESTETDFEFISQEKVEAELQWIIDNHGDRFVTQPPSITNVVYQFNVENETLDVYFDLNQETHVVPIAFSQVNPSGTFDAASVSEGGFMYRPHIISGAVWLYLEKNGLVEAL